MNETMNGRVWIHVSNNDRNGNPCGMAGSVQIGEAITFESHFIEGGVFVDFQKDGMVKVCGECFVYSRRHEWWGSMAFNGYEIAVSDAARLMNALHGSEDWQDTDGWNEILDLLEAGEITTDQLSRCLEEV